ncbi:MAG TPA: LacI family DNA-binding transcriptional regulator [Burkholderiaceae bacterium]|nr:LacI family DNA-binding transcriptional regulator [Burkholderiaceae bacterium]
MNDSHRRRSSPLATIRDVARRAGVSIGTASKALNGTGQLREETRARVLASAQELAFRPNELAHSLHRGQSFTVGVISNDSFGRFGMPIVEGLEACMTDSRMSVFMCNATDDPQREARHVESLLGKRVDGIVVTGRRADRREPLCGASPGLPVVYVFTQTDAPDALCLLPDDHGGAFAATEHLIRLGRKRIAHVTGPERFEAVRLRRAGYRDAHAKAGLQADPARVLTGEWSEAWGRAALLRLFDGEQAAPDAIFCGNDQIARGIVDGLRERGIVVPRDVSVVGFDNWEVLAEAARPPLTSVDMNLQELGREAGRRLIELIAGERHTGIHRLPCSLVVRESCGAASPSS